MATFMTRGIKPGGTYGDDSTRKGTWSFDEAIRHDHIANFVKDHPHGTAQDCFDHLKIGNRDITTQPNGFENRDESTTIDSRGEGTQTAKNAVLFHIGEAMNEFKTLQANEAAQQAKAEAAQQAAHAAAAPATPVMPAAPRPAAAQLPLSPRATIAKLRKDFTLTDTQLTKFQGQIQQCIDAHVQMKSGHPEAIRHFQDTIGKFNQTFSGTIGPISFDTMPRLHDLSKAITQNIALNKQSLYQAERQDLINRS